MPVVGLNDYRDQNNNNANNMRAPNSRPMPVGRDQFQGDNVHRVAIDDPDNGPIGQMFPSFSKFLARDFGRHTFIFYITIIQILMFIVELIWGQVKYDEMFNKDNTMAGPGTLTMRDLGGKDTYLIREGEIWRLVLPAILHGGILHIFMNLAFQTYLCYTYERLWGTGRIAYFYFLTAIGASIMSAVCSPQSVSVGASGSLFGMLGCQMSYLIMNWNSTTYSRMNGPAPPQGAQQQQVGGFGGQVSMNQMEMCNLVCIILMNFMFSGVGNNGAHIDNYAHGGGLISGFLLGFVFVAKVDNPAGLCSNEQYTKLFFLAGTLAFYGSFLGVLFFNMNCTGPPVERCA